MARNIIICCDGTGNEIEADLSNVLKLYRILKKNDEQIVYYDPGIGTLSRLNLWAHFVQKAKQVFCLSTGYGLDENIMDAYKFLIDTYQEGDRVYLFGFSRGAYTVRALAGFLHLVGLLKPEQKVLCDYALTAYKQVNVDGDFTGAARFAEITCARKVPIHFIGVWDTVSSVLVPRPDRFFIPSLQKLPYTAKNPMVKACRQAIAIDERRRMFRLNAWREPQDYHPNPFDPKTKETQDIRQVWFSGVHADVGGGYPEKKSALAKFPLAWMITEAKKFGLLVNASMYNHLALGKKRTGGTRSYVAPEATAEQNNSLTWPWLILEVLPKFTRYPEWPRCIRIFGVSVYIPFAERRCIPEGARIHQSVIDRMTKLPTYKPCNLPSKYEIEPMEGL